MIVLSTFAASVISFSTDGIAFLVGKSMPSFDGILLLQPPF